MKLSPGGHHSLPRKKTPLDGRNNSSTAAAANVQQFQRGQPLRRSCLSPTQYHHQQHQQQQQQQQQQQPPQPHHHQHRQQESSLHFEYFVPRSVSEFNLAAAAVTDMAVPPPPPASVLRPSSAITPPVAAGVATTATGTSQTRLLDGGGNTATRSREKMVTFEDEGVSCATSTPTRKNLPGLENVFM